MLLVPAVQFTSVMVAVGLRGLRRKRGMGRWLLASYSTRGATVPAGTVHRLDRGGG